MKREKKKADKYEWNPDKKCIDQFLGRDYSIKGKARRIEKKEKEIEKHAKITSILTANNACKRDIATLKQIMKLL